MGEDGSIPPSQIGSRGIDNTMRLNSGGEYGMNRENDKLSSRDRASEYLFDQGLEKEVSGHSLELAASFLESDPRVWTEAHIDKSISILETLEKGNDLRADDNYVAETMNYIRAKYSNEEISIEEIEDRDDEGFVEALETYGYDIE